MVCDQQLLFPLQKPYFSNNCTQLFDYVDQQLLFPLQKPYFSKDCTRLFDYVADNVFHLQDNQLSTNDHLEKEMTMDTHVQTIPRSFRDDVIAHWKLLYVSSC
jgi:hypothetical protein